MTHLMSRHVFHQTAREGIPDKWHVLDPLPAGLANLYSDLRHVWKAEFGDIPFRRKAAFSFLRLLQHVAYWRGYGRERVKATLVAHEGRCIAVTFAVRLQSSRSPGRSHTESITRRRPAP